MLRNFAAAALMLSLCLVVSTGRAHKVNLFAWAEGNTISGYVYFPGGARAQNVPVRAMAPDGTLLGKTTTNDQGEFTLETSVAVDHHLVADLGEGHAAEYTLSAEELGGPEAADSSAPEITEASEKTSAPSAVVESKAPINSGRVIQASALERIVAKQIFPLREQIERYENRVRLHDILGGIGYLFGLAGVVFYINSRKRA